MTFSVEGCCFKAGQRGVKPMFAENMSCGASQTPVPALLPNGSADWVCFYKFTGNKFLIIDREVIILV